MNIRLKNVKVYSTRQNKFEKRDVCINNGVFVGENNFNADEVWDCENEILIPNFVSNFGGVAKEIAKEVFDPKEIARRVTQLYFENGYSKIVEEINDFELAKAFGECWIETQIVSGDLKLLEKIKRLNKRNLTVGVVVDLILDSPDEIDEKVTYAHKNGHAIYTNLYESLMRAGEISTQYSKSPIEVARDFGMLDGKLVSTNNVCLDKEDIVQMGDVSLCVAPKANMFSALGFEPLGLVKNYEKDVGFWTPNEFGLDMFENMRAALCVCRASMNDEDILSEKDVLGWATGVCGLCPENNKIASFLLINSKKSQKNIENIVDLVKFSTFADIKKNVVAGKVVYKK